MELVDIDWLKEAGPGLPRVPVLGVPVDENSSYEPGAAEAPEAIAKRLFWAGGNPWTESGANLSQSGLFSYVGAFAENAEDTFVQLSEATQWLARSGYRPILIGGDHSISIPILRGLSKVYGDLSILHIDAHPDLYDDFDDNPNSHASPFARIMEEGLAKRLVQVGIRTLVPHLREQIARFGVECFEMCKEDRLPQLNFDGPVYLSIDMDGLDPAFAPGVSHREPGGLTTRQVIDLIHATAGHLVAADVVEYNPRFDIGDMTAQVAAKLVREAAGVMLKEALSRGRK
ncbi:MAG: agmatinase family protein [Proteobacteria bacterium]|nr:agmatinase family protein [Pseudomonadota bacterium]